MKKSEVSLVLVGLSVLVLAASSREIPFVTNDISSRISKVLLSPPTNASCLACEIVVTYLQKDLIGLNISYVNESIRDTCLKYRHNVTMCTNIASDITIMLEMFNLTDPWVSCHFYQICPPVESFAVDEYRESVLTGSFANITCEACTIGVKFIDEQVVANEAMIQSIIDQICHRLPPPIDKECLNAIDSNFHEIIQAVIDKFLSPTIVCTELLNVCP